MKKFIIACTAVIIAVTCWMFVSDRIGSTLSFNMNKEVKTFTTVSDKEILVDTGNGMEPFEIRGVDMGVGIPGHFATDYAIDKETYLRWFRMIKDMGANCVRVYTLLQDDFYDAVWEFNHDNPDPLYIIHGVWIDDYVLYSHRDAYSKDFLNEFLRDSRILVDMIHGNKRFSLGEDLGSGSYTKDISPWVLGYILGVEWEDTTVAFTDHMQEERDSYEGKYMRTTEEATPFETMLAQVGDKIIEYETEKYSSQRLIAFSNWPTTDPLEWNQTVEWYFRKFEQVDVEHIKTTDEFLSGQFASYHIYPYFPDYLGFMDVLGMKIESREEFTDEDGTFNSYRAYLTAINAHHTMPVIISEYGVPSSRGRAQSDRNTGRSQGGMSEEEQGKALVQCYKDIMASGCAGSVAFTWQDEWFKRTWNTMANVDLLKTPYWSDYQTNEQFFGLLSFDPGDERSVSYVDGDDEEWADIDVIGESEGRTLSMKYDEKFLYFMVRGDDVGPGSKLYLPIDTTQKTGSTASADPAVSFERASDFLVVLDGQDDSRVLVQERYEVMRATSLLATTGEDPYVSPPAPDTDTFKHIDLVLQTLTDYTQLEQAIVEDMNLGENEFFFQTYETGKLTYGDANPSHEAFDSMADFCYGDGFVEIKLPWQLLNFSNPSEMQIHDDYYEHYGVENMQIDRMYVGVGDGSDGQAIPLFEKPLKGWGTKVTYHERLKESYYVVQHMWAEDVAPEDLWRVDAGADEAVPAGADGAL